MPTNLQNWKQVLRDHVDCNGNIHPSFIIEGGIPLDEFVAELKKIIKERRAAYAKSNHNIR